jgi:hypothetical protein
MAAKKANPHNGLTHVFKTGYGSASYLAELACGVRFAQSPRRNRTA